MSAVLAGLAVPAYAYEECPTYVEPEVVITTAGRAPEFDNGVTMSELKRYGFQSGLLTERQRALAGKETSRLGGLTVHTPRVTTKFTSEYHVMPSGDVCAQVKRLDLELEIKEAKVYVAKEFSPYTCSYDVILEHELKHVAEVDNYLQNFQPVAERHVREFLGKLGMIEVPNDPDGARAKEIFSEELNAYATQFGSELSQAFVEMGEYVDTEEEYLRLAQSCNGETQRVFSVHAND